MNDARYAPPKAIVEDATKAVEPAPPLWNPNAAASWCLVFTPIFGTWLHLRNWQAIGNAERLPAARAWFYAAIAVQLGSGALTSLRPSLATPVQGAVFGFLIAWFYAAGKPQVRYVKARFGDAYPRKGWTIPLLSAVGLVIVAVVALGVIGVALGLGS